MFKPETLQGGLVLGVANRVTAPLFAGWKKTAPPATTAGWALDVLPGGALEQHSSGLQSLHGSCLLRVLSEILCFI
ncbi:hypothetical protein EVAR_28627_1 [Eumeta japonica]|uniref:Uncharacterized protein n=1 Tax=Eumeta variegata TaxID=151549 RepID=A0A4C1XUG8_EUMVA|nr:hypothetical protein EVAR_28627_1 [Eumeta japonica]